MTATLRLPLKRQWFEMIRSGEKLEEYREITPYWIKRLTVAKRTILKNEFNEIMQSYTLTEPKDYDCIVFTLGYPKSNDKSRIMKFKFMGISIGKGKWKWGAPEQEVFKIKIGDRIK